MSAVTDRAPPAPPGRPRAGPVAWLTTTDHKKIGLLYCATAFAFFLFGGALAGAMRAELAGTGSQLVGPQAYNTLFTVHGITMIFLFVAPFGVGLANYLVPLQIGAPDMAFPRLNAMSYWFFAGGGLLVLLSSFATDAGGVATGWYLYPPLSGPRYSPGAAADLLILGLALVAISTLMSGVNVITTTFLMRAPGMTMWRLPIFTWNAVVTALLGLVAFPPAVAAFVLLLFDRRLGGHAFDPGGGGDPIVYQHLFWFLGHPEVYILILPFFGVITEIIPVFSRKRLFGYTGFVLATLAIGALSTGVWAHHMFTTGVVDNPFFSAMTFTIAVPTGVKFFNWIGTMWGGRIVLRTPDALLDRVPVELPDRRRDRRDAREPADRLPGVGLLLPRVALPLHDDGRVGLRHLRRDLLLVAEGVRVPIVRAARSRRVRADVRRLQPHVLAAVRGRPARHAQAHRRLRPRARLGDAEPRLVARGGGAHGGCAGLPRRRGHRAPTPDAVG